MSPTASRPTGPPKALRTRGVLLFAFIPVVLFLFTVHPEPLAISLVLGVALMLGHRLLARPYMERARPWKCLWCNRRLAGEADASTRNATETVQLSSRSGPLEARCCQGHGEPTRRFLSFLERWRHLLAVGIFGPLLVLLGTLAAAAAGWSGAPVETVTAVFQVVIGVTVNAAAFGYLAEAPRESARVPFPVHNFFLLGVGPLLWIFRIVGLWWIVRGLWRLAGS